MIKNSVNYKKDGKIVYNFVSAKYPDGTTRTVIIDGEHFSVDDSFPITLERCHEIYNKVCAAANITFGTIRIECSAFEPGDYDGANPKLWDKMYTYNPKTNSLIIRENGEIIYANENGMICKDKVALADDLQ